MSLMIFAMAALLGSQALHSPQLDPATAYISAHSRIVEGEATKPVGSFYIGGYSAPGGSERDVIQFYAMRSPDDDSPEGVPYVSIPLARRVHEGGEAQPQASWVDGRTCPQLYGVMYEFSRLSAPAFSTPRFTEEPPGSARMGPVTLSIHAPVVSVWGYARQSDGVPMSMTISGTDGIIARWVSWVEDQLSGCWKALSAE
jgi:hypothetical protein